MSEPVLYRKYRPAEFDEVVGQPQVVAALRGSIESGRLAHAYLFAGPRGTGKTTLARLLAKAIGTAPSDLYEIDAASNRGIDEIRALRDAVGTLPFSSRFKVYLIDEAHMLTREAFNALLKTLEEPPAHVIFVLATTEAHKLPETVVSRCQSFTFRPPSLADLQVVLQRIAAAEGWSLEPAAAELVSLIGEGSFRDAIGVLQQLSAVAPAGTITAAFAETATGAPGFPLRRRFVTAVLNRNLPAAFAVTNELARERRSVAVFLKLVLRILRTALLVRLAPAEQEDFLKGLAPAEREFIEATANHRAAADLPKWLKRLLAAHDELGLTSLPTLPLELALVEIIGQTKTVD